LPNNFECIPIHFLNNRLVEGSKLVVVIIKYFIVRNILPSPIILGIVPNDPVTFILVICIG
jgi:hypothetical protein